MEFGIIDIVLIALTVLIALIGLKKGIVKQLTGGVTLIGSIILAIFVYKYVANYVLTSDLFYNINEKFYGLIASKADEASMSATIETAQAEGVKAVLSAIKIPGFLHKIFTGALEDTIATNPNMTVGDFVSNSISTKAIIKTPMRQAGNCGSIPARTTSAGSRSTTTNRRGRQSASSSLKPRGLPVSTSSRIPTSERRSSLSTRGSTTPKS